MLQGSQAKKPRSKTFFSTQSASEKAKAQQFKAKFSPSNGPYFFREGTLTKTNASLPFHTFGSSADPLGQSLTSEIVDLYQSIEYDPGNPASPQSASPFHTDPKQPLLYVTIKKEKGKKESIPINDTESPAAVLEQFAKKNKMSKEQLDKLVDSTTRQLETVNKQRKNHEKMRLEKSETVSELRKSPTSASRSGTFGLHCQLATRTMDNSAKLGNQKSESVITRSVSPTRSPKRKIVECSSGALFNDPKYAEIIMNTKNSNFNPKMFEKKAEKPGHRLYSAVTEVKKKQ